MGERFFIYMVLVMCCQDEYTSTQRPISNDAGVKFPYGMNQPGTTNTHPAQYHSRAHRGVYNTADLTSSLPYGLDSQPQPHRLLQHSHSLPSSPHKLQPCLPVQSPLCAANVYHRSGSFSEVSYGGGVGEKISRSKVLPKEVP